MNNSGGKIWRKIGVIAGILFAVMGVVYGYGRLNGRVEAVEDEVKKVDTNEKAIVGLQKDVEYIREAVDRIEGKL